MNDVSVIRVSRCGITRGTLSGKHVLTLIWMIMTGSSFKIVSNWAVLTTTFGRGRWLLQFPIVQVSGLGEVRVSHTSNCFEFYRIQDGLLSFHEAVATIEE